MDTYTRLRKEIDSGLERVILAWQREAEADENSAILQQSLAPMVYALRAGGKRLRPALALMIYEILRPLLPAQCRENAARDILLQYALAIELIHTYSLVHDDLPAMDDDALRRGRPATHIVYGEAQGILAGDSLLTAAFTLMAQTMQAASTALTPATTTAEIETGTDVGIGVGVRIEGSKQAPSAQATSVASKGSVEKEALSTTLREKNLKNLAHAEVMAHISKAAGHAGMIAGQIVDMDTGLHPHTTLNLEAVQTLHRLKTGALIDAACLLPAILFSLPKDITAYIARFSRNFGLCFQLVDDLLDVRADTATLGKPAGSDMKNDKSNYLSIMEIAEADRYAEALGAQAIEAITALQELSAATQLSATTQQVAGQGAAVSPATAHSQSATESSPMLLEIERLIRSMLAKKNTFSKG